MLIQLNIAICSLLLRRECCTFSNGEYVKAGLAELELWCCQAKEEVSLACLILHIATHGSLLSALLKKNLNSFLFVL